MAKIIGEKSKNTKFGEGAKQLELSYTADGKAEWYSNFGMQFGGFR